MDSMTPVADDPEASLASVTEESISIEEQEPPKKPRGRPRRPSVAKPTPQPAPKERTRNTSAQPPSRAKTTPTPAGGNGVRGRKPKAAVVPETQQVDMSVVQEEEEQIEEVEFTSKPRQGGGVLPPSLTKKASFEVALLK
jgi:hypothetical protein